jgi:hypothetical protein
MPDHFKLENVREWELISGSDPKLAALLWRRFLKSKPRIRRCSRGQEPFLLRVVEMRGHCKSPLFFIPTKGQFKLVPEPILEAAAMSALEERFGGFDAISYICSRTLASLVPFYFVAHALGFASDDYLERDRFLGRALEQFQSFKSKSGVSFLPALNRAIQEPFAGYREAAANCFQFHGQLLDAKEKLWRGSPFEHAALNREMKRWKYLFALSGLAPDRDLQVAQTRYGSFEAAGLGRAAQECMSALGEAGDLQSFLKGPKP